MSEYLERSSMGSVEGLPREKNREKIISFWEGKDGEHAYLEGKDKTFV